MVLKKIFSALTVLTLLCALAVGFAAPAAAYTLPEDVRLNARAAAVVFLGGSAEEDAFIYEKDADAVHAPAALVRLMAGAYTLKQVKEKGLDMNTVGGTYTLDLFNTYVAGTGVTAAGMEFGEQWSLRDLLTVSMIQTASDAAITLAATVSGSVEEFVAGMNALATEIGCEKTHFANVTGLDSLSQYTTVRDLYRILRYAMQYPEFAEICSQVQYNVQPLSGGRGYTIVNRLDMLRASSTFRYTPLKYGRTGLSEHEGWGLASVASDSGYDYLVIVLGCPTKGENGQVGLHYLDTMTLFRWAFRNFTYKTLLADSEILSSVKVRHVWGRQSVNLVPAKAFSTVVPNTVEAGTVIKKVTLTQTELTAPIEKGTVCGKVELIVNVDEKIGEVELVTAEGMQKNALLAALSGIGSVFTSLWFWLIFCVLLALIIGYVVYAVLDARRHRRRVGKKR